MAKKKMKWYDWVMIILVLVGGINWGLVGLFGFDLVAKLFGEMSFLARTVYSAVGISALVGAVRLVMSRL